MRLKPPLPWASELVSLSCVLKARSSVAKICETTFKRLTFFIVFTKMERLGSATRDILGIDDDFICCANSAVKFKLVRSPDDIRDDDCSFNPELSHQIFGSEEKIYGYKNLSISIFYSAARLNIYVGVKHDEVALVCVPDNIEKVIFEKFETRFLNNLDEFEKILNNDKTFKPCGELLKSFKLAGHDPSSNFEVYHCTTQTPEWLSYHSRLQTFILWFIDAASFIVVDDNWKFFVLYEKYISAVTKEAQYAIIGYATVYEYYAYPANIRPRISQVLIFPPFQKRGLGAILLNTITEHYSTVKDVLDITVEDPSPEFQQSRDFVDCINCKKLPAFAKDELKRGYSDTMAKGAQHYFKINKKQARRVYEILRLLHTDRNDNGDFTAYRLCVKKRLNALYQRDVIMMKIFNDLSGIDDRERKRKLKFLFNDLLEEYSEVVNRLEKYDGLRITG